MPVGYVRSVVVEEKEGEMGGGGEEGSGSGKAGVMNAVVPITEGAIAVPPPAILPPAILPPAAAPAAVKVGMAPPQFTSQMPVQVPMPVEPVKEEVKEKPKEKEKRPVSMRWSFKTPW